MKYFVNEQNCDLNCKGGYGKTLLHTACVYGHLDVVKYLIEQYCELEPLDNFGVTPLTLAYHNLLTINSEHSMLKNKNFWMQ